jgi:polyhydroxyalkanoate synthesis repressor PhaR
VGRGTADARGELTRSKSVDDARQKRGYTPHRGTDEATMKTIKRYPNRKLYDTAESRYITLEELGDKVREGQDVQVLDAKTGEDLTALTLTQIVLDGRGAARWLPVAVLTQLARLQDELLAEFFGKFMSYALELYLSSKRSVQAVAPYMPFGTLPLAPSDAFARMLAAGSIWGGQPAAPASGSAAAGPEAAQRGGSHDDIAELRRELEELKRTVHKQRR